jgi:CheY-like chemotaxis protein
MPPNIVPPKGVAQQRSDRGHTRFRGVCGFIHDTHRNHRRHSLSAASDYQLPMGYTGDEIIAELIPILASKPPTILLTGDIADEHVEKAKSIADRILPKPVDVSVLLGHMAALLGRTE